MFKSLKKTSRGFSLIELLVVIGIIGVLSSIVLVSLASSRAKSRDAKRVSDVVEIQKALELYFDNFQTYPSSTPVNITFTSSVPACAAPTAGTDVAIQLVVCKGLFNQLPIPPPGGGNARYVYKGVKTVGSPSTECATAADRSCVSYALGIGLERDDYVVLSNDPDQTVDNPSLPGTVFYGTSDGSCVAGGSGGLDKCYDVKP